MPSAKISFFLATSGHSGVDRAMANLITEIVSRGFQVDQLKVRKHGPHLDITSGNFRVVDLGTSHTYTALPALVRYLRHEHPAVMLSDKDRVNRTTLLAKFLSRTATRTLLRSGTTLSIDLANRGRFERWLQKQSIRHLYPNAYQVIVPSHGAADDMAAFTGLDRSLIRVIPTPIVPDSLFKEHPPRPRHPWFEPGQPPIVLSVGELGHRKDFPTLLRAFAEVRKNRPCRLIILGRGKQEARLRQLAADLSIAHDFLLPGFIERPYAWMAHADVFAFSSQWEGMPLVLAEALALGTPVVSTDCPSGPSEILQRGLYGPLVRVGDHHAMANAIEQMLDNPIPAERLREAARPYSISLGTNAYLQAMGLGNTP